jgi:hypothetical protein
MWRRRRIALRLAHSVLSFADGDVENLLGKLDGIARTFGHETSIAQAAPSFYPMRIQTDALPYAESSLHR